MNKRELTNFEKQLYLLLYIFKYGTIENPVTTKDITTYFLQEHDTVISTKVIEETTTKFNVIVKDFFDDSITLKTEKSKPNKYCIIAKQNLNFSEARIIIDLIFSSNALSKTTKLEFITQLKKIFNISDGEKLQKTIDTHIYRNENSDRLYKAFKLVSNAIYYKRKISFYYLKPSIRKQEYSLDNRRKNISPIETYSDNNVFYLVAYDENENKIKHYRMDYMYDIYVSDEVIYNAPILYLQAKDNIINSVNAFSAKSKEDIYLMFDMDVYGNIIDQFGSQIETRVQEYDETRYIASIPNCPISDSFYAWIMRFGGKVVIHSPKTAVNKFDEYCARFLSDAYKKQLEVEFKQKYGIN